MEQGGPGGQEVKDPNDLKQHVTMARNAFPDFHITIEDMVAEGDKVACRFIWRGTHKGEFMGIAPTGKQVTAAGIATIEEGILIEGGLYA